ALDRTRDAKPDPNAKRQAVVLPANAATASKEARQFGSQLRAVQPGTIQIVIRIHQE
ncbi:MAG: hypothetical protein HY289_01035, partial [Planctomycetes bacterium]|nr:hypothetical protein [Planctomycetota bacterium]